jgi:hypothetical protein
VADLLAIPRKRATPRPKLVHQFLVVLSGTDRSSGAASRCPSGTPSGTCTSPSRMRWAGSTTTFTSSGCSTRRREAWSCMKASSRPMTTVAIRVVSPVRAGVRRRTVVASTAMPSSFRSSLIPIMRSTSRPFSGPGNVDPEAFDPAAVKFDDPKKRWKKAFGRRL